MIRLDKLSVAGENCGEFEDIWVNRKLPFHRVAKRVHWPPWWLSTLSHLTAINPSNLRVTSFQHTENYWRISKIKESDLDALILNSLLQRHCEQQDRGKIRSFISYSDFQHQECRTKIEQPGACQLLFVFDPFASSHKIHKAEDNRVLT